MQETLRAIWMDDSGQDVAEYAIMLALIAVAVITAVGLLRDGAVNVFGSATDALNNAAGGGAP